MFIFQYLFVLIWLTVLSSYADAEMCFDNISNSSNAITALILARGGSKGIKLKNIQEIDEISLLGISLTALQEANRFETIWVSTDHQQIADEAARCGSSKASIVLINLKSFFVRPSQRTLARPSNCFRHDVFYCVCSRVLKTSSESQQLGAHSMHFAFHYP